MKDRIDSICKNAKNASKKLGLSSFLERNEMLKCIHDALILNLKTILEANSKDLERAKDMPPHFVDRLRLTNDRIRACANGALSLQKLPDPLGRIMLEATLENGLRLKKISVPFGVVGIIYEARPLVTADAAALCLKSGNAVVLRGSKDAVDSNLAIVNAIRNGLADGGFDPDTVQLSADTSRESVSYLMTKNKHIDVLIPRGSKGLIDAVVNGSTIPTIETGTGNCHIYVEKTASLDMARDILLNAKMQRQSVCNACESLLCDRQIANEALPALLLALREHNTEIRGCPETLQIFPDAAAASHEDYASEYLGNIISVKVVEGVDEAVRHINEFSSHHSDSIITTNGEAAEKFLREVDSAAVYVNASTRFSDGFEFGFGAEMGISTQKLHARGPMGLNELTSYKYTVVGDGQIRR